MAHLKKNDVVKVISGKEKGRQGKILKLFPEKEAALVERLNFMKRHTRAGGKASQQGGIIEKEAPIKLAKLVLVCPKCSKTARTGNKILDDGTKVRVCKRCGEQIEN